MEHNRNKKGKSLLEWMRFCEAQSNLTNVVRNRDIDEVELAKHNTRSDCWMALGGSVYNMTTYLEFHPGGIKILEESYGKDATQLFNFYHSYVNYSQMLKNYYIGRYRPVKSANKMLSSLKLDSATASISIRFKRKENRYLTLRITHKRIDLTYSDLYLFLNSPTELIFSIKAASNEYISYIYDLIYPKDDVMVSSDKGRLTVLLFEATELTSDMAKKLPSRVSISQPKTSLSEISGMYFHKCNVTAVTNICHNVKRVTLKIPNTVYMTIPLGGHVNIRNRKHGIMRPYTASPSNFVANKVDGKAFVPKHYAPDVLIKPTLVDFVIKIYDHGQFTHHLKTLDKGDILDISGPFSSASFPQNDFMFVTHLFIFCAGSGIVPMLRIILYALKSHLLEKIDIYYSNRTKQDIIYREQLSEFARLHPKFNITYLITDPMYNNNETSKDDKVNRKSQSNPSERVKGQDRTSVKNESSPGDIEREENFIYRRVDKKLVERAYKKAERIFYPYNLVCGPKSFNEELNNILDSLKIKNNAVHYFS